jgi:hypothetical protein
MCKGRKTMTDDDDDESNVTDLATRRRRNDVLHSVTLVLGGVHYGTFAIDAPYAAGKPIVLYVVPADRAPSGRDRFTGPLDCLVTDDGGLAYGREAAR